MAKQQLGPLQEKWVEELESGKHKQWYNSHLHIIDEGQDKFSCLGIAIHYVLKRPGDNYFGIVNYHGFSTYLSDYITIGLYSGHGSIKNTNKLIIQLNNRGYTFPYLAKLMRRAPHLFFEKEL